MTKSVQRVLSLAAVALATTTLSSLPVHALVPNCAISDLTATFANGTTSSAVNCTGSWDGNLADSTTAQIATVISEKFGLTSLLYAGKTGDATPGPFANDIIGSTVSSGVLTFAGVMTGKFVIGLHGGGNDSPLYIPPVGGGGNFSLYLFDGDLKGGITQVSFDMKGTSINNQGKAQNLSHAALYGGTITAVPEPGSYALMLAGLAVVGFLARRRG